MRRPMRLYAPKLLQSAFKRLEPIRYWLALLAKTSEFTTRLDHCLQTYYRSESKHSTEVFCFNR